MEKDKEITIITKALEKKELLSNKEIGCVVGNTKELINKMENIKKENKIIIYDITNTKKRKKNEIINISDHINQTGENWLRGKQKKLNIDFVDITQLYNTKKEKGVITTSLGRYYKKEKEEHSYPSTDMCNIAITLKGLGYKNIKGRLINGNI